MSPRIFLPLIVGVALVATGARAANSAQALTPQRVSVAGGETYTFSARFFDALGQPSVGETVQFGNDACGRFPNGNFYQNVTTDVSGTASIQFTAFAQGITCWVSASAGASVRFDVLTYVPSGAYVSAVTNPPQPRPGQPFTIVAAAMYGAYNLYNADITARVIPGTASAALSTSSANSGQSGTVSFGVTPDHRLGDYDIEVQSKGHVQRIAMRAPPNPWQDLWWSGFAENGWGMSIVQRRDILFGIVYAYDAAGKPTWYVMPGGAWNEAHTAFTGAVYIPKGSPYYAYDTSRWDVGPPVGSATLTFTGADTATLDYTITGITDRKSITRFNFARPDTQTVPDVGDMWWGGIEQNGWGISAIQQSTTLFLNWYTYDAGGAPTWYVMPGGIWSDAQTYEGNIYHAVGPPWLGRPYDVSAYSASYAGWFRIRFDGDKATFEYLADGKTGTIPLVRFVF